MNETLIIWCSFLLSMSGVAAWQYGKKRDTSREMRDEEEEGVRPPAAVSAARKDSDHEGVEPTI